MNEVLSHQEQVADMQRLEYLLRIDYAVVCGAISMCFLIFVARQGRLLIAGPEANAVSWEWQSRTDFELAKIIYGFFSMPFALFLVPIFMSILVHLKPTGYTKGGRCVLVDTEHERYDAAAQTAAEDALRL